MLQLKGMAYMVQMDTQKEETAREEWPKDLLQLLEEFTRVFSTLQELPPSCPCDHRIPLIDPQQIVSVRPYCYPFHQKNEIEKLIRDMLLTRTIRPS